MATNGGQDTERDVTAEVMTGELSAIDRTEIDMRIATAKRYPRSITAFRREALEMATLDEETAGSCFYILPRAGKKIEGQSVRLAEICVSAYGNLEYGARAVEVGDKTVTAEGICYDLEKNNKCVWRVTRRITDKYGKRFSEDMVNTTMLAAMAIGFRQSAFKIIPQSLVKPIYEEAKKVSIGKALTMEQRRQRALDWFAKVGIPEAKVLQLVKRKGLEDITVDDLIELQGIKTAITDGDTTVEAVLKELEGPATPAGAQGSGLDRLAEELKKKRSEEEAAHAPEAATTPAEAEEPAHQADTADLAPGAAGDPVGDPARPVGNGGTGARREDPMRAIRIKEISELWEKLGAPEEEWEMIRATVLHGAKTLVDASDADLAILRSQLGQAMAKKTGQARKR